MPSSPSPASILSKQEVNACRQATEKWLVWVCGSWSESGYETEEVTCGTKASTLCTHRMTHHSKLIVHRTTPCHINDSLLSNTCQKYPTKMTVFWHNSLLAFSYTEHYNSATTSVTLSVVQFCVATNPRHMACNLQTFTTANCWILRFKAVTISAVLKTKWWHEGVSLHLTVDVRAWW
jgi:hypothetical protein